jgi:hypothetical protein
MRPELTRPPASRPRAAACAPAALVAALVFGAAAPARAVEVEPLKAAIVYNLLSFVEWPSDVLGADTEALTLCVDARHPLAPALRPLAGQPVRGRRLEMLVLADDAPPARRCHAYVAARLPRDAVLLQQWRQSPVLVIADGAGPEEAAIRLLEANDRIVFEIDLASARRGRLGFSSRVLRLARRVLE